MPERERERLDEPSGWELKRMMEAIDRSLRDGLAQINSRIDRSVSQDAFQAEQRRVDDRLNDLATDMKNFSGYLKWLVAAIFVPIICVIIAWLLGRGGHA